MAKRLDIVIYGASGFTGEHVVRRAIQKQKQESTFTFGIAGRSAEKLEEVLNRAKKIPGLEEFSCEIILADVNDSQSLRKMCDQAKILINCVGPYRFFGEQVVKAAIDSKTHYVDISGEPQFLEGMQLKYDDLARNQGVYVVGACGFDSIPSELGISFTKKNFAGDLNSVETYMSVKAGPEGAAVHYGTWESAVHSFSTSKELGPLRKQLYTTRLPRATHKVEQKTLHFGEDAKGWTVPFPGSDRAVARRTEYLEFTEQNKRPVQVVSYLNVGSIWNTFLIIVFGAVFSFMANFQATRDLLLKYPKVFSMGLFSHEGPTDEQIAHTSFLLKIIGYGYPKKLQSSAEVHTGLPTKKIVVNVSGPEPGYAATSAFVMESAFSILQQLEQPRSKIPRFGVLTPGYAFETTDMFDRLAKYGVEFHVETQT